MADSDTKTGRRRRSALGWIILVAAIVVAAVLVFFLGYLPRHKRNQVINEQAQERTSDIPKVNVVKVHTAPTQSELVVPGTTIAYTQAYIYARASGYVRRRLVDIGDHVRAGQLLAVIDAPDLDQQVAQARSNLAQSQSNVGQLKAQLRLASVTWDRYKVLVAKGVLSRQEGDTQEANLRVAEANVQAAESSVQGNRENLERNVVLQQYERVTAPFSGVVTDRNVDVGALISASGSGFGNGASTTTPGASQSGVQGNNQGTSGNVTSSVSPSTGGAQGGEMFQIANVDRLRILVSVPEAYSDNIHVGQRAKLLFQERPNDTYEGRVTRTSASIDQNTRTLLVEVQVKNLNGQLLPGMYVVVNFVEVKAHPPLLIPGEAIVIRDGQTTVASVEDKVIHYRRVTIGRDYGDETEISRGLRPGDLIVTTVTDQVRDGAKIDPQIQKQNAPATASAQTVHGTGQDGQYGPQGQANKTQGAGSSSGKGGASK